MNYKLKNLGLFKDYDDGTLKKVFEVENNEIIEMSLLMNKDNMDVICAPTHHFCNLGCKMCHLTNKGLNKCMKTILINDFLEAIIRTSLDETGSRRTNKDKLLISFMGVGEPLLNLKLIEEVYKNEEYLKNKLGYKKISYALATMMPNDNILKLIDIVNTNNIPLKVHFSMHNPIDSKRNELIPSSKVNVEEGLSLLNRYREVVKDNKMIMDKYIDFHRTNDPVEIHYTLIKDVNDGDIELEKLCELLKKYKITLKFIRFNPINALEISNKEDTWISNIKKEAPDVRVKVYAPPGRGVGSSCGEFTKHYYHMEIETKEEYAEFLQWKKSHEVA